MIVWQAKERDDTVASIACFQETATAGEDEQVDDHHAANGTAGSSGSGNNHVNGQAQNGERGTNNGASGK